MEIVDYNVVFDTTVLGLTKAERLIFGESMMTHAMVLTAIGTDDGTETGKVVKWRVSSQLQCGFVLYKKLKNAEKVKGGPTNGRTDRPT